MHCDSMAPFGGAVTCDTCAPFDPAGGVAMKLAHDVTLVQVSCFSFLPRRVCPLVNLPSIKRADPTALSPIPPKT
jgi:hypothetical protein